MKTKLTLTRVLVATSMLAVLGLTAPPAQADPPDKDSLPPGLQKKDKLPPGWQKKVAKSGGTESAATNAAQPTTAKTPKAPETPVTTAAPPQPPAPTPTATKPAEPARPPATTGSSPTPATGKVLTKEQQERQARLARLLSEFETAAAPQAATDRVLARLARFTDMPVGKVRERWEAHPGTTIGQFFLAVVIVKNSDAKLDRVLADHKSGKSWGEVAAARNVPIATLNSALVEGTEAARAGLRDAERKAQRVQAQ